jgi:hypothetical protein
MKTYRIAYTVTMTDRKPIEKLSAKIDIKCASRADAEQAFYNMWKLHGSWAKVEITGNDEIIRPDEIVAIPLQSVE